MNRILFFGICFLSVLLTVKVNAQLLLPVRNLQAHYFLNTSWDAPRKTILTQDFEGVTFPPTGWQERTNHAVGWYMSEGGSSTYFIIPEHTQYALVNDDAGGTGIDGCCEYLISPALDLTVCDGFKLTFDSYFNGNNDQKATVEMSTDNGLTWSLVEEMIHYPTWKQVEIDLSQWSGNGGLSSVLFAFHADDQGNQASGWAVDNVVIQSDSLGVTGYTLFLNQNQIAVITETEYFISPGLVTFGQDYSFCVRANYPSGSADTCVQSTSYYLAPPDNLIATPSDTGVWFTWQTPFSVSEIVSYNIYYNNSVIANVPVAVTSWFFSLEFGEACIGVTAAHDASIYGFPQGTLAESEKESACGFVDTGFDVPFEENWTSGSLTLNKWTAGSNWSITGQVGNEAPSVKYEGGKSSGSYSSALTSWHFNSMGYDDCPMGYGSGFRYNVKLSDISLSGTEELIVELLAGNHVYELKRYKNEGSFDWLQEDFDITLKILDNDFQLRFRTEGVNPSEINAWYIDNIRLYTYISDNWGYMEVQAVRQGNPENDIRISWNPVTPGLTILNYILDDGTVEHWQEAESDQFWMGNEFSVSDAGVLQKASVICNNLASAQCIIDFFDANRNLVGSSAPFTPQSEVLTDVYLPDIPFSGTFYAMIHLVSPELSIGLGTDGNGPNASGEYSWVYDGTTWTKLDDYSSQSGVFAVRVSALIGETVIDTNNTNPCDILGYNIYRKEYSSFPAGPNQQGSGEYNWIGSVPFGTNEFVDRDISNISNNCFEYRITMQHLEGEGGESSSAWSCIYVGQKELQKYEVNIYPNPARDYITIEMKSHCLIIMVYDVMGSKVAEIPVKDQSEIHLNVSNFAPGIYSMKFNTANGESFSRKFVKL